jgi:hypothetical protein
MAGSIMAPAHHLAAAARLMAAFAERTGVAPELPEPRRYLWTDAHAVCNYLGLYRATGEVRHRQAAMVLVEQVHATLGRHRPDDPRRGWISGLDERAGREHPTAGGLRIGKMLPERAPDEPYDAALEWDRDGQYFHYLTRWMHALARCTEATGAVRHLRDAVELAQTACARFMHSDADGRRQLCWKMSIDLSRPLVPAMGQHDAIDGLVTCLRLRATCERHLPALGTALDGPIADLRAMAALPRFATADPLGIGGLLTAALTLAQLPATGRAAERGLLAALLRHAAAGLGAYVAQGSHRLPAAQRLAFRELGLAIGLQAVPRIAAACRQDDAARHEAAPVELLLRPLAAQAALVDALVHDWLQPEHQATPAWRQHRDIDEVMLASALVPEGCLGP